MAEGDGGATDRPGLMRRILWWFYGPLLAGWLAVAGSYFLWGAYTTGGVAWAFPDFAGVNLVLLGSVPLAWRRRAPLGVFLLVWSATALLVVRLYFGGWWLVALEVALAAVISRCRPRAALGAVVLVVVLVTYAVLTLGEDTSILAGLGFSMAAFLPAVVGGLAHRWWSSRLRSRRRSDDADGVEAGVEQGEQPEGAGPRVSGDDADVSVRPVVRVAALVGVAALLILEALIYVGLRPPGPSIDDAAITSLWEGTAPGKVDAVAIGPDGAVWTVGTALSRQDEMNGQALLVRRYAPSGALEWETPVETDVFSLFGTRLVPDDQGGAVLAVAGFGSPIGTASTKDEPNPAMLVRLDESGEVSWRRDLTDESVIEFAGLVPAPGGGTVAALWVARADGEDAVLVRRFDENGDDEGSVDLGRDFIGTPTELAVAADGTVFLAGTTSFSSFAEGADAFLVALDREGRQLWERRFDGDGVEIVRGMVLDGDGRAVVVGSAVVDRRFTILPTRSFVWAVDADGSDAWEYTTTRPATTFDSVVVGPSGSLMVAGGTGPAVFGRLPVGSDYFIGLRTFDDGELTSTATIGSDLISTGAEIAVGPGGDILVGGSTIQVEEQWGTFVPSLVLVDVPD